MKKILCIAVLACVIMGSAFAQQRAPASPTAGAKSSAALDIMPLFGSFSEFKSGSTGFGIGIAASYERLIAPHWSAGPNLIVQFSSHLAGFYDYIPVAGIDFTFGLDVEGRYYPFADFDMLFLGATLGFRASTGFYAGYTYDAGTFGLNVGIKAGYKLVTSKRFYMEPAISWNSMGTSTSGTGGFAGHLRLGMVF